MNDSLPGILLAVFLTALPLASAQELVWEVTDPGGSGLGLSHASLGDINGDGFDDMAIGQPFQNERVNVYLGAASSAGVALLYTVLAPSPGGGFGWGLVALDDIDGDSIKDFAVGDPFSDAAGPLYGRVEVRSGANGRLIYRLNPPDPQRGFGRDLSFVGDLDGDGLGEFAVTVDGSNQYTCTTYLFSAAAGTLLYRLDGYCAGGQGGVPVVGGFDANGDGAPDFAVGYPYREIGGTYGAGAVDVISGATGALIYSLDNGSHRGLFGYDVVVVEDHDGDGVDDLAIGAAHGELINSSYPGDFPGFLRIVSSVTGSTLFEREGTARYSLFGKTLSADQDLNADGVRDLVVGAAGDPPVNGSAYGGTYVLSGVDMDEIFVYRGISSLYYFVGGAGDFNGDGFGDFIIGTTSSRAHVVTLDGPFGEPYCDAAPNSAGIPASAAALGSPLASANDLTLRATALPSGASGFFISSREQASVPGSFPNVGRICLGGRIGRHIAPGQVFQTPPWGAVEVDIDLALFPTPVGLVTAQAGETWYFQAWYRDQSSTGAPISNLTQGLRIRLE